MENKTQEQIDFENQNQPKENKEAKQENKAPVKEQPTGNKTDVSVKKAPPSLPKKLLDAGFQNVLIAPKQAFIAAGGTELQFNREINFAVGMLMNNDYLFECACKNPEHFIEAIKNVALTGLTLNPELKLAYLLPRSQKVRFSSSYMGKTDILMRAGVVRWIEANLVYKNDNFKVVKGTDSAVIHEPNYFVPDRGELMGGYWIAVLPNGQKAFDVMSIDKINSIKQRSEAVKAKKSSPWDTDFEEMAKKTIINWAFKSLPKSGVSDDMVRVLEIDSQIDNEDFEDWKKSQQPKEDKFDEFEEVK